MPVICHVVHNDHVTTTMASTPQTWVAVGQWVTNELLLRRLSNDMASTSTAHASGSAAASSRAGGTADVRLRMPGSLPRSVAVASLAGHTFLCVGTAAGDLLYLPLEPDGPGSLRLGPGRLVTVGISGVAVEFVPARDGAPAHVYAQADQAVCLRVRAEAPSAEGGRQRAHPYRPDPAHDVWPALFSTLISSTGSERENSWLAGPDSFAGFAGAADSACGLLEAVRVHNGDGVVAAVSVHTVEMPNSMAWVSGACDAPFRRVISLRFTARVCTWDPCAWPCNVRCDTAYGKTSCGHAHT